MPDHVHLSITIPPNYPMASVISFLKNKSAIAVAHMCGRKQNLIGRHFWDGGYAVSTVGFDLEQLHQYKRDEFPHLLQHFG